MQSKTNLLNIVLIDDDSDDIRFMEEAIDNVEPGTNLISFDNPLEAMHFLSTGSPPDLVIIDMNMPLKRGDECLSDLRKLDQLKDVAIIMYSTTMTSDMTRQLLNAGATAAFQKPILAVEYGHLLQNVFETR